MKSCRCGTDLNPLVVIACHTCSMQFCSRTCAEVHLSALYAEFWLSYLVEKELTPNLPCSNVNADLA